MESTSIYKYRIKKKWTVDSSGNKTCRFYPQYNSKLFGWRNMFQTYSHIVNKSTLLPDADIISVVVVVICMVIMFVGLLVVFFDGLFITGLLMNIIPAIVSYFTVYLRNKYTTEDVKRFNGMDAAKVYISRRLTTLEEKKKTKKKVNINKEDLPDDEVFYLDLKVERAKKLKRINRKFKFGF